MILLMALAWAHPLDPVSVAVVTGETTGMELRWSVDSERPSVALEGCVEGPRSKARGEGMWVESSTWACERPPQVLSIDATPRMVLLRTKGAPARALSTGQNQVSLEGLRSSFFALGIRHLLEGADHVAFVVGMTALLGAARPLVLAVTAFTVGHALTLWLAALGWSPVPVWVAEVGIAGSLVALGVELQEESPWWHPAVPLLLGLVHGLGFAASLQQLTDAVSLPALVGFNLGVEVGQLLVVAVVLGLLRVVGTPPTLSRALGWGIGVYGAMLLVERCWS